VTLTWNESATVNESVYVGVGRPNVFSSASAIESGCACDAKERSVMFFKLEKTNYIVVAPLWLPVVIPWADASFEICHLAYARS